MFLDARDRGSGAPAIATARAKGKGGGAPKTGGCDGKGAPATCAACVGAECKAVCVGTYSCTVFPSGPPKCFENDGKCASGGTKVDIPANPQ